MLLFQNRITYGSCKIDVCFQNKTDKQVKVVFQQLFTKQEIKIFDKTRGK